MLLVEGVRMGGEDGFADALQILPERELLPLVANKSWRPIRSRLFPFFSEELGRCDATTRVYVEATGAPRCPRRS